MQLDAVYCYDKVVAVGITVDELYALNLALNGDCRGLWAVARVHLLRWDSIAQIHVGLYQVISMWSMINCWNKVK
jgi:hypothetical protein